MVPDVTIPVADGELPVRLTGAPPGEATDVPALVVVPSIFGPADDLLDRLGGLGSDALVAVPDPFWRTGEGVVPYENTEAAFARLSEFDFAACAKETGAAVAWARETGNGRVAALGVCFGGPYVLGLATRAEVDAVVTWHGSGMEGALEGVDRFSGPTRHHFGADDPITPPETIEAVRDAFASHPDTEIVVHDGATHGFSHDGEAFDAAAAQAAMASVVDVLDRLRAPR